MMMKSPSLFPLLAAALVSPVFALTIDDISPSALLDKTITFTASSGTGLLPASGKWTGKCLSAPAGTFTITNTGGGIVQDHSTTYSATVGSGANLLRLGSAYPNAGISNLTLTVSGGQGAYSLSCTRLDSSVFPPVVVTATQVGTFTLESSTSPSPEITVKQGAANLIDGTAKASFGTIKVGGKSAARTYRIINSGKANLTGIKITSSGKNKADFIITKPAASSLAPGASTTFRISFKPAAKGIRNAAIRIASNDADENPFDIKLTGLGGK